MRPLGTSETTCSQSLLASHGMTTEQAKETAWYMESVGRRRAPY